jgi:hypothetical protein
MLQLLLGPLGGGSNGGKGPDSPSDSSAVASPVGLSLSPLPSPLSMASVGSPGPLSPSRSGSLHSRSEVDQRTQSRRKISTPPKVDGSHFPDCAIIIGHLELCISFGFIGSAAAENVHAYQPFRLTGIAQSVKQLVMDLAVRF